jgi:uncharacterized protein YecT (DUF1311 family)
MARCKGGGAGNTGSATGEMKMGRFGIWAVTGCFWAAPACAQNCTDPQTQMDLNLCAYKDFQAADAALNATYKEVMAKVSPAGQASLRKAEKSWIAYRDDQCAFETLGTVNGTINAMFVNECDTELTIAQTKRLAAQLHCQEGDASCGGQ